MRVADSVSDLFHIETHVINFMYFRNFVLQIVNCDNFTRVFLNRLGINVPDPINWPDALEVITILK